MVEKNFKNQNLVEFSNKMTLVSQKKYQSNLKKEALKFAKSAIIIDPTKFHAIYIFALCENSEIDIVKRIRIVSNEYNAISILGDIYKEYGNNEKARVFFKKSICLAPEIGTRLQRLCDISDDLEALTLLSRISTVRTTDKKMVQDLATILSNMDDKTASLQETYDKIKNIIFRMRKNKLTIHDKHDLTLFMILKLKGKIFRVKQFFTIILNIEENRFFEYISKIIFKEIVKNPEEYEFILIYSAFWLIPSGLDQTRTKRCIDAIRWSTIASTREINQNSNRINILAHRLRYTMAIEQRMFGGPNIVQRKIYKSMPNFIHQPSSTTAKTVQDNRRSARPDRIGFYIGDITSITAEKFAPAIVLTAARSGLHCNIYTESEASVVQQSELWRLKKSLPIRFNTLPSSGNPNDEILAVSSDRNHVYVDLRGYSKDSRIHIVNARPARTTAVAIGSGETSGLSSVDVLLSDKWVFPTDRTKFPEKHLIALPSGILNFRGDDLPVVPRARSRDTVPTFGAFHQLSKVSPESVRAWSSAMHAVPESRLILKINVRTNRHLNDMIYSQFGSLGIPSSRILIVGRTDTHEKHLQLLGHVDVLFDAFPFNGLTTTLEALWAGVPLISMPGERMISRYGASILHHSGFGRFCASDANDFAEMAKRTIKDKDFLHDFRQSAREELTKSPTFNMDRYIAAAADSFQKLMTVG